MTASTFLKILSFAVCVLIFVGLAYRRNRRVHPKIMMTAFIIDVAMVLYIELTRQAVEKAIEAMHPFVTFHVLISVGVMVLYIVQMVMGIRLMRGAGPSRLHGRIGWAFVVLRLANFITSLSVEQFVRH